MGFAPARFALVIFSFARESFSEDKDIIVFNYDSSVIEEKCGSAYIPPYGSLSLPGGLSPGVKNYSKLIFTVIDDNGHKITIEGKVNLLSP